jgi:hypothetical protein
MYDMYRAHFQSKPKMSNAKLKQKIKNGTEIKKERKWRESRIFINFTLNPE